MALFECTKVRHENPLKEFDGLTYVTTGLSIVQARCEIESGGYCIKDGYCYVKIKLKSKYSYSTSQALNGLPASSHNASTITSANEIDKNSSVSAEDLCGEYVGFIHNSSASIRALTFVNFPNGTEVWLYSKYPV